MASSAVDVQAELGSPGRAWAVALGGGLVWLVALSWATRAAGVPPLLGAVDFVAVYAWLGLISWWRSRQMAAMLHGLALADPARVRLVVLRLGPRSWRWNSAADVLRVDDSFVALGQHMWQRSEVRLMPFSKLTGGIGLQILTGTVFVSAVPRLDTSVWTTVVVDAELHRMLAGLLEPARDRPSPGWYPDPEEPSSLRWWDGNVWAPRLPQQGPDVGMDRVSGR